MSSSRLSKFQNLVQYRNVPKPDYEAHYYSCLSLSELSHRLHIRYGTTPESELWHVFYGNKQLDAVIGVLDVALKNSDWLYG